MSDIIVAKTVTQSHALNDLMHECNKSRGRIIISQQNQWSSTQFECGMAFQAQPNHHNGGYHCCTITLTTKQCVLNDLMHECNKTHGHNLPTKFSGLPQISNPLWHSKQPNQRANIIAKCQKTHSPSNALHDLMHDEKTR
jgi:hypothetical protein